MRSDTPEPTICGAMTEMSPTTRSAIFSARATSTFSAGSNPSARAALAVLKSALTSWVSDSKYAVISGLAAG